MGRTSWFRPYFFDASALVKLVLEEKGSRAVRDFCSGTEVIRTTWLSLAEAYGVLKRSWQKEKWSPERYYRKIYALQRYAQKRIKLDGSIDLSDPHLREVKRIHGQYAIDFSDSLHIVLLCSGFYAHLAGESRPVLVASDRKLLRAAKSEGIITWDPEKEHLPSGPTNKT